MLSTLYVYTSKSTQSGYTVSMFPPGASRDALGKISKKRLVTTIKTYETALQAIHLQNMIKAYGLKTALIKAGVAEGDEIHDKVSKRFDTNWFFDPKFMPPMKTNSQQSHT